MAERPTLVDPPMEALLDKVESSKFTLVAVGAARAREINRYWNGLGQGGGPLTPPQVHSGSNKSLSIAFEELFEGKLTFHRPNAEELEAERLAVEAKEQARRDAEGLDAFSDAFRDA
ncbi:MAG: DNA-directed RNA polymerase subunit omega [Acidimicrobiaceae bacterium]|nr:DNA-directed RNA polymerase subunit omega [Acidimicrobiaceae bacterium]